MPYPLWVYPSVSAGLVGVVKSSITLVSMDFLEGLNPQQREAVCHKDGPLLILAGAGSGKTRVITHRVARLMAVERVPAASILAVTFTNKAAREMQERVARLAGGQGAGEGPWISTFHSFAVRLLRRYGASLADLRPGFTTRFSIYDEDDQLAMVKAAYRRLGLDEEFMTYRAALSRISAAKNRKQTPEDLHREAADPKSSRLAVVYEQYEANLRGANALDFDDLLLEAVRLLAHDQGVREMANQRFAYLMIDEYQDTNRAQYELMRLLTAKRRNVCVVGDEDQSIYGWRGADIRNILDFERDYPDVRVIRLEQNYRSTRPILDAAGALVAHNTERRGKKLWTEEPGGLPVGLYEAADGEQEAVFVAQTIRSLLGQDPAARVAVLYRTNAQSRQLEEALRRLGVDYRVVGGFSFYQRAEIRDVLAYLKLLVAPLDPVYLLRIINTPARGIGRTTVEQLQQYANKQGAALWTALERMLEHGLLAPRAQAALDQFRRLIEELRAAASREPLAAILRMILDRTGYRRMLENDPSPAAAARLENLDELLNAAAEAQERGEDVAAFLDHAALVSDADAVDERASVSLLTLHNAKGLEFPVVFITGMEEGLCPHGRSAQDAASLEEERRLCYVGMTRARQRLILSWTRARRRFGAGSCEPAEPSRFLAEIPSRLAERLDAGPVSRGFDLTAERHMVREAVSRTAYTGKTYNSVEHIRQFFNGRDVPGGEAPKAAEAPRPAPPRRKRSGLLGMTVEHPRFGKGTVVRSEGEGENAKLTVSFPGYGLKKLVRRYAGLKTEE